MFREPFLCEKTKMRCFFRSGSFSSVRIVVDRNDFRRNRIEKMFDGEKCFLNDRFNFGKYFSSREISIKFSIEPNENGNHQRISGSSFGRIRRFAEGNFHLSENDSNNVENLSFDVRRIEEKVFETRREKSVRRLAEGNFPRNFEEKRIAVGFSFVAFVRHSFRFSGARQRNDRSLVETRRRNAEQRFFPVAQRFLDVAKIFVSRFGHKISANLENFSLEEKRRKIFENESRFDL